MKKSPDILAQAKGLWQETFGDSQQYVDLVSSLYFKPANLFYIARNDELISNLVAVPYKFCGRSPLFKNISDFNKNDECLMISSAYLCGLATRRKDRKKGLMSKLINESNDELRRRGIAFTFLIPAEPHLRYYYKKFGYVDVGYQNENNYISGHRFADIKSVTHKPCDYSLFISTDTKGDGYTCVNLTEIASGILLNSKDDFEKAVEELTYNAEVQKAYSLLALDEKDRTGCGCAHTLQNFIGVLYDYLLSMGFVYYISSEQAQSSALIFIERKNDTEFKIKRIIYQNSYLREIALETSLIALSIQNKVNRDDIKISIIEGDSKKYFSSLKQQDSAIPDPSSEGKLKGPAGTEMANCVLCNSDTKLQNTEIGVTGYDSDTTTESLSMISGFENPGEQVYAPYNSDMISGSLAQTVVPHDELISTAQRREPFGMAKLLNVAEVLKFAAASYPNSKYSILVNVDEFDENCGIYHVKNSAVEFKPLGTLSPSELQEAKRRCASDPDWYELTVPELAAILWRNVIPGSQTEAALTIPAVPLHFALLME